MSLVSGGMLQRVDLDLDFDHDDVTVRREPFRDGASDPASASRDDIRAGRAHAS